MFISLEGPEGSGKSTQAKLLYEYLQARGFNVVLTREPGGTEISEQVREVLHSHGNIAMAATTECLLYNAARAQIVAEIIRPALQSGRIVLSDRYADSTLAYQGYGRQLDLEAVKQVIEFATGGLKPDLTILIDVATDAGLLRRANGKVRGEEWNRMDALSREFHERVRRGYLKLMEAEPARWVRIDGTQSIEKVQADLRAVVDLALARNRTTIPSGGNR